MVGSGASGCSSCSPGTFSEDLAVNCSACPAGKASKSRASECTRCVAGYFAATSGAETCLQCESEKGPSYTSSAGSASCELCVADWYMAEDGCREKEEGMVVGRKAGTTLETLELESGYFRLARTSDVVVPCHTRVNCQGGVIARNDTADVLCRTGSSGVLCSTWQVT